MCPYMTVKRNLHSSYKYDRLEKSFGIPHPLIPASIAQFLSAVYTLVH
jgi:hypothetical protein